MFTKYLLFPLMSQVVSIAASSSHSVDAASSSRCVDLIQVAPLMRGELQKKASSNVWSAYINGFSLSRWKTIYVRIAADGLKMEYFPDKNCDVCVVSTFLYCDPLTFKYAFGFRAKF